MTLLSSLKKQLRKSVSDETVTNWHKVEATAASLWYGQPKRRLKIIGVTGTNGKTSVCHYVTQILEEAGKPTGMLTTVAISIRGKRRLNKTKMTTLTPFALHRYLKEMVAAGCEYAVIETTSHALVQQRIHGLYYQSVAFTNLSHEHLDYHKTMSAYQKAKEQLFAHQPRVAVINADDAAAANFLRHKATVKFTYGILDTLRPKHALPHPDISATKVKTNFDHTTFTLTTPHGEKDVHLNLPGRFTIANVLAAVGICLGEGIPLEQIKKTLARLTPVEGRLEPVEAGQPFSVIVDFAHTPDALQQVYSTIRPMVQGRLITVLGSMGDRDKTKRPILGALAARYADFVIITNEDPVTEDPTAIINEIAAGIPRGRLSSSQAKEGEGTWWWRIPDRREAIGKALGLAQKNDVVLITGKGGEHVMAIGQELIPWNDVKVVKEFLAHNKVTQGTHHETTQR